MIGAIGTIPKTADFETYDAWPKKLWPHGKDLLENALSYDNRGSIPSRGNVTWLELRREHAPAARMPPRSPRPSAAPTPCPPGPYTMHGRTMVAGTCAYRSKLFQFIFDKPRISPARTLKLTSCTARPRQRPSTRRRGADRVAGARENTDIFRIVVR